MGSPARGLMACMLLWSFACAKPDSLKTPEVVEWRPMTLLHVFPTVLLPGSRLWVEGGPFPDASFGSSELLMEGTFHHQEGFEAVFERIPVRWERGDRVFAELDGPVFGRLSGGRNQSGLLNVRVKVVSTSLFSGKEYTSDSMPVDLTLERQLTPRLEGVQTDPFVILEKGLDVSGDRLLLSSSEGESLARISGCFLPSGASGPCATEGNQIGPVTVPVLQVDGRTRQGGRVPFPGRVFGVHPGRFTGTIQLENHMATGEVLSSTTQDLDLELLEVELTSVLSSASSIGGFVDISGQAFVMPDGDCFTTLSLVGVFTPREGEPQGLDLLLVPRVANHDRLRHVLDEQSDLGTVLDLRRAHGVIDADLSARVCCGARCQDSNTIALQLTILPVLQKVVLEYQGSYSSALAYWGLTGVEMAIRDRAIAVIRDLYDGIHIELQHDPVDDYALYSRVEIHGYDPNGYGLFGYDNSPGKDVGNLRLHDVLGGQNAQTQEDGYPGYGGVFLHSFLGLSTSPPAGVQKMEIADSRFDRIFDPFRPDRGGTPVNAQEASSFVPVQYGPSCLAVGNNRMDQVACAVYTLGTMMGTTLAHEIGHSLGLAQPYVDGAFHNVGDAPLRLMDTGDRRPFEERAGLSVLGMEAFCVDDFLYLRDVLPHPDVPGSVQGRPGCE